MIGQCISMLRGRCWSAERRSDDREARSPRLSIYSDSSSSPVSTPVTSDHVMMSPLLLLVTIMALVTMAGSDPGLPTIYPSYLRLNTQVKKVSDGF